MTSRAILCALPAAALLLTACASDRDDRDKLVSDQTWQRLKSPLDADAVAQIALRNRPDLRAGTQPALRFMAEAKAALEAYQGDWELESRLERILAGDQADLAQQADGETDKLNRRTMVADTEMAILAAQKTRVADREKLNRMMGLSMAAIVWSAKPNLPPLPARDPGTANLQLLALDQRRDLLALRQDGAENATLRALQVQIGSEVREASRTMFLDRRQMELCRTTLLPLAEQMVKEAHDGRTPASELFSAQERRLEAERAYVAAWRDYWIARANLEAAVGGALDARR